jgi:hypothetical protein
MEGSERGWPGSDLGYCEIVWPTDWRGCAKIRGTETQDWVGWEVQARNAEVGALGSPGIFGM